MAQHQQGILRTTDRGDVINQGFDRQNTRQRRIGKVQHPITDTTQLAGEKDTESHIDIGNYRKDHGNFFADGEILVKHSGG